MYIRVFDDPYLFDATQILSLLKADFFFNISYLLILNYLMFNIKYCCDKFVNFY